jgi:hypothetical protein
MNFWSFGAIFVDFSEARDFFVNIFQFLGPNCKITDCGLISKKHKGFFAKWRGITAGDLFFNG